MNTNTNIAFVRGRDLIKRICLFLICVMLTITSIPMDVFAKNSDKASVMRIEEAVGTVKINSSNASAGMQLYSGDTVSTESSSYSHISLDSSKLVKLSAKSQASISKAGKKLEIALVSGEIFFDVKKKLSGDESMTMKAGSVAMSVRGTSGLLRIENKGIRISIYDGVVDISCPSGSFTMWGGETAYFNPDGTVKNRDLVDAKRMSEFEDQVIATDVDVIGRASVNFDVNLPIARYNARGAGQKIEENVQQVMTPNPPIQPKPEEKKVVVPPTSSSSSHSSDHHSSGDSHDDDSSGGGSGGSDDPKPDPEATCDHNWTYENKVENHIKTCSKCGQTETENHTLTYSKMENYPKLHLEVCALCGFDNGVEHSFDVEGHFDKDGNTTENQDEYYTRKCVCDTVDSSSRVSSASIAYDVYSFLDTLYHKCTKADGTFTEEEHVFVDKYNSESEAHLYCSICGYEIFKHSYVSGNYLIDGTETNDMDAACYFKKCSVPQCGKLVNFDYENYPGDECDGNHNYIYVSYDKKTCDKVCGVCHYLPGDPIPHVPITGEFNKVTLTNGEQYYSKKCSNCGYLYPESIVRKIKQ